MWAVRIMGAIDVIAGVILILQPSIFIQVLGIVLIFKGIISFF